MNIDREPLYDLDDNLLGHSCSTAVSDFPGMLLSGDLRALSIALEFTPRTYGLSSRRAPLTGEPNRHILEWFQPLPKVGEYFDERK